jgi:S1-C subfamily serine protease
MRSQPLACILLLSFLLPAAFPAGDAKPNKAKPNKPAPVPALKAVPENVDDLRALEKQVQAVIAKVQPATVGVMVGFAQGSGVIIKDGYVLTAGHVSGKPGRPVIIRLPDGRKLKGKTLGRNDGIDSGLMKIEEAGKFPSVEMGKSTALKKGQWVIAIGHPGGFRPNRTPVVRLGRVLSVASTGINTDCALVGGDSGGPLFDLEGKVVGIHSRIGPFNMSQNFHVPMDTYVTTWDRLAKGESWGSTGPGQLVQSPGGKVVFEKKDRLTATDPKDKSLKSSHHKVYTFKMAPGALYTLDAASSEIDSYLRLEDSSGKELARDDDSAGNSDARIVFLPKKEDTYRIVVTTFKADETGPFALTVRRLEVKEMAVQGRVNVLAALQVPRFHASELIKQSTGFLGTDLYVNGTILDAAGKPVADKEFQFQWDGGKASAKTNGDGIVRLRLSLKNFKDLVLDLPKEHQALLELTNGSRSRRIFHFPRQKKAPTPAGTIVLQLDGQITPSDPMDRVRAKCRHTAHMFKVSGGPKATYTIDLESTDFDAFLRVEGSDGKQLAEDDDSAGEYNSRVVLHPQKDDNLRLIVTTCDPGQWGAYRLIVRRAETK